MGFTSGPSGVKYGSLFKDQDRQFYIAKIARAWCRDPTKLAWMDSRGESGRFQRHTMTALALTAFDDLAAAKAHAVVRDTYNDRLVGKLHAGCAKVLLGLPQDQWEFICGNLLDNYDEFVDVARSPWFNRDYVTEPGVWPGWARQLLAEIEQENAHD
jgi:hypothetical protein